VAVQREPSAEERHQQWIRAHSRFVELERLDDNRSAIDAITTAREQIERSRLALDRSAARP
jgi:hypothetical protein